MHAIGWQACRRARIAHTHAVARGNARATLALEEGRGKPAWRDA